MNSQGLKQNVCRVCLDENVFLDWNTTLKGFCNITYKDCFYKYTQLECLEFDPFSTMLCQICLEGLYNIHTLILKALEAHRYFQETYTNFKMDNTTDLKEYINYRPTEFETVLLTKSEDEPIIQGQFVCEHTDELNTKLVKTNVGKRSKRCHIPNLIKHEKPKKKLETSIKIENKIEEFNNRADIKFDKSRCYMFSQEKSQRRTTKGIAKEVAQPHNKSEKILLDDEISRDENEEHIRFLGDELLNATNKNCNAKVEPKTKNKYKELKKPRMCSICSKILHNKYAVQMHEKTHMENRERNETCKICGLKFYDKRNLYSHKRIHKENREKNHKCEFCDKAFYNKGALNIHRRIHLGQMVPCNLCKKQFFRQIDLERHMSSHSATAINSDTKKRSRYFVRCEHCDKSILSTSFKSHTAAHLNEPLMKCSICSKEFFRRGSCVLHVKKVHQKTNEEYNNFIIKYKKNRISHLYLAQKADIQFSDE